ncbi:hypothetical protein C8Q79DRAFT_928800 [Trametes meyenii]|nr:hypothetical protein C8Q79DRAFT_928800 [Trametes meyenii]
MQAKFVALFAFVAVAASSPVPQIDLPAPIGPILSSILGELPIPSLPALPLPTGLPLIGREAGVTGEDLVARDPDGILPTGILPTGILPTGILPTGILPTGILPTDILPTGILPTGIIPTGILPPGIL